MVLDAPLWSNIGTPEVKAGCCSGQRVLWAVEVRGPLMGYEELAHELPVRDSSGIWPRKDVWVGEQACARGEAAGGTQRGIYDPRG